MSLLSELPQPPKPYDIDTNDESRHEYRRRAAEVMNINAQAFQRSCRTRMTMNAVEIFKDKEKFYCPFSLIIVVGSTQSLHICHRKIQTLVKVSYSFADAAVTEQMLLKWLKFQVATTYGRDKDTIQDRQDWVIDSNISLIIRMSVKIRYDFFLIGNL